MVQGAPVKTPTIHVLKSPLIDRKYLAETLGTFCLVFAGCGAVVVNDTSNGAATLIGIALAFGLVVLAMIYTIGDLSGAHINPAVTLGFFAAGRFEGKFVIPYIVSQLVGAILACVVLRLLFPDHPSLGLTAPSAGWSQSFGMEVITTAILMFVILSVTTGAKERGITAGLVIGGVIAMEVILAGPISGGSMNPARSIGPALISGQVGDLWIYLIAPVIGAGIGVFLNSVIRDEKCCAFLSSKNRA